MNREQLLLAIAEGRTNFDRENFARADLEEIKLPGISGNSEAMLTFKGANFSCANLQHAAVHNASFEGALMADVRLRGFNQHSDSQTNPAHVIWGNGRKFVRVVSTGSFDVFNWALFELEDGLWFRFGCEEHPLNNWEELHEPLARVHIPYVRTLEYAQATRLVLEAARAFV